jgi:hypothetical protein
MPAKRRTSKRRTNPEAELAAWEFAFLTGFDYCADLEPYGITGPGQVPEAAARDAWRRLGREFLNRRDPNAPAPWALGLRPEVIVC